MVNPGGEPERDETGLPPVDIEIPDDARELERDVQAYHRERRALRRRQQRSRWHRSLGRDGVVLPLLACCLILALITGTLLTVFTATSNQSTGGSGTPSASTGTSHPTRAASPGSPSSAATNTPPVLAIARTRALPTAAMIAVLGYPPIPMDRFKPAMLVLVPAHCGCVRTLDWLADVAAQARAAGYLVFAPSATADVLHLYRRLSLPGQSALTLAEEPDGGVLTKQLPAGIPANTLTAIMVAPSGRATYVSNLDPRDNPAVLIRAIA